MTAEGSIRLWDTAGTPSEWDAHLETKPPALAGIKIERSSGAFVLLCRAEKCSPKSGGGKLGLGKRQVKGDEGDRLETTLRSFRRFQFANLVGLLRSNERKTFAEVPPDSSEAEKHLIVEFSDSTYKLTMNSRFLLTAVKFESKSGVGSGVEVTYADYVPLEKSQYPKRTTIKLPGGKQNGIEVIFTDINPGSAIKEKDFPK